MAINLFKSKCVYYANVWVFKILSSKCSLGLIQLGLTYCLSGLACPAHFTKSIFLPQSSTTCRPPHPCTGWSQPHSFLPLCHLSTSNHEDLPTATDSRFKLSLNALERPFDNFCNSKRTSKRTSKRKESGMSSAWAFHLLNTTNCHLSSCSGIHRREFTGSNSVNIRFYQHLCAC